MEYLTTLAACPLFNGIAPEHLPALLDELHPVLRNYQRGEMLLLAGYPAHDIGIVLSGTIAAEKCASDGAVLSTIHIGAGGIFADVLAGNTALKSPVSVSACEAVSALWLPYEILLGRQITLSNAQGQLRILQNLIALMSQKYFVLDARVDLLLCKTIREKVFFYLEKMLVAKPHVAVHLPCDKSRLAAILGCERAALSRVLSQMSDAGEIKIEGRSITIL